MACRFSLLLVLLVLSACADDAPVGRITATAGGWFHHQPDSPPAREPYCTRTLADVECWANPQALPGPPREIADGGPRPPAPPAAARSMPASPVPASPVPASPVPARACPSCT